MKAAGDKLQFPKAKKTPKKTRTVNFKLNFSVIDWIVFVLIPFTRARCVSLFTFFHIRFKSAKMLSNKHKRWKIEMWKLKCDNDLISTFCQLLLESFTIFLVLLHRLSSLPSQANHRIFVSIFLIKAISTLRQFVLKCATHFES